MPAFRHLRGLVAALTALLLTAGIVLGAQELMPAAAEGGLQRAEWETPSRNSRRGSR
jgi:hypothetical protein